MASVSIAARDSFFGDHGFLGQQPRQVARGAERPLAADAHEIDAARRIFGLQRAQARLEIDALRQPRAERLLVERLRGGKQQRLQQPQMLRPHLGVGLVCPRPSP